MVTKLRCADNKSEILLTVSPTSILTPPAGPPETLPVLSTIDPLDPCPPFDAPVLNVNVPLEPSLSPEGALASTAQK